MGQTIAEKILSRASGRSPVKPGEILWATPDVTISHDHNYPRYRDAMEKMGVRKIADPGKLILTVDHRPYSDDVKIVQARSRMRAEAARFGIKNFFDVGRNGISHNIPLDHGLVMPGMLVITSDTRSPALGCVGALSIALGGGLVTVLVTGRTWLRVPSTLRVLITGSKQRGVMSRDVAAWIAHEIGLDRGDYRAIEFDGPAIGQFDLDERHTLCNAMVDIGAKGAIVVPDARTEEYVDHFKGNKAAIVRSDPDAVYEQTSSFDISDIEPQVAVPPDPENVRPIKSMAGEKIHQAFVGSCMGGKMEDLRAAAAVLRGQKVHPGVRLIVIPATYPIFKQASEEGLIDVFASANAYIAVAACGPCYGTLAPLCDGEVCISTSTRNEPGRMGSPRSTVYLASAAAVAASAVRGVITDPRDLV